MVNKILFQLFRAFVFSVGITPFWILQLNSHLMAFVLYHVVGYRKKVVYSNLHKCFPEKDEKEIRGIARKFYLHLSDVILETLKGFYMSERQLKTLESVESRGLINIFWRAEMLSILPRTW